MPLRPRVAGATTRTPSLISAAWMLMALAACANEKPDASPASAATRPAVPPPVAVAPTPLLAAATSASDSTLLSLALATDTTGVTGKSVRLPVAHVQSVMTDRGFWIGIWGQQVYVFQTARTPRTIRSGETVSLGGLARTAPRAQAAAAPGMTAVDLEALHASSIYIAADSVVVSER